MGNLGLNFPALRDLGGSTLFYERLFPTNQSVNGGLHDTRLIEIQFRYISITISIVGDIKHNI